MDNLTKREIRTVSSAIGAALMAFVLIGMGYAKFLIACKSNNWFDLTYNVGCMLQIVYTFLCVFIPFVVANYFIRKIQNRGPDYLPLNKPADVSLFRSAVFMGMMAMLICNFMTAYFVVTMERFGFTFDNYDFPSPDTPSGYFWLLLSNAVVPALVEEYAMRGVVLQSLRRYGERYALLVSSIIFALMHGNLTQAPFAFMLGLVIGRLVLETESMWTGILIHVINNSYAVLMTAAGDHLGDAVQVKLVIVFTTLIFAAGIISMIWFYTIHPEKSRKHLKEPGGPSVAGRKQYRKNVWAATLSAIPMAISLIWLVIDVIKATHLH